MQGCSLARICKTYTKINFFTGDQGALFTGLFVPPVSPPSHINWNLTAPLGPDIPGQFPTYGNYGGLNYTGGKIGGNDFSIPALDPLDNAFRTHDQKYADAESLTGEPFVTRAMVIADRDLLTQISQIRPEELNADGHLYAALVTVALVQKINLSANFFSAEEQQAYGLNPGDLTQYLNFAADQVALSVMDFSAVTWMLICLANGVRGCRCQGAFGRDFHYDGCHWTFQRTGSRRSNTGG